MKPSEPRVCSFGDELAGKAPQTFGPAAGPDIELAPPRARLRDPDALVTVTMTVPTEKVDKLHAFMAADTWEQAMAARDADLAQCRESLMACVRFVFEHRANSTRFIASVLASLYNGERVQVDLSNIGLLDMKWAAHVLNVIRLRYEDMREPHSYFKNGGELFERIIREYRLEKRRRRAT